MPESSPVKYSVSFLHHLVASSIAQAVGNPVLRQVVLAGGQGLVRAALARAVATGGGTNSTNHLV